MDKHDLHFFRRNAMNQLFLTLLGLTVMLPVIGVAPTIASLPDPVSQPLVNQTSLTQRIAETISQRGESSNPPRGSRGAHGGSRGPICVISPGEQGNSIWSNRPLFLWKTQQSGMVRRITVRNLSTQGTPWTQDLETETQHVTYEGSALEPGQYYQWVLSSGRDSTPVDWNTAFLFKVMESSQRDQITDELQRIETELSNSHASVESIALKKAQYLQDQDLQSDALQTLYSVSNPSATVTQKIQEISSQSCPDAESGSPGATN
jgi:hypothetical protein